MSDTWQQRVPAGRLIDPDSGTGNKGAAVVSTAVDMKPAVHARESRERRDESDAERADGDELGTDAAGSRAHPKNGRVSRRQRGTLGMQALTDLAFAARVPPAFRAC